MSLPSAGMLRYQRGDLFDKRGKLMEAWAEFVGKAPMAVSAQVVDFRSSAA
jgi:hypothetical protein